MGSLVPGRLGLNGTSRNHSPEIQSPWEKQDSACVGSSSSLNSVDGEQLPNTTN